MKHYPKETFACYVLKKVILQTSTVYKNNATIIIRDWFKGFRAGNFFSNDKYELYQSSLKICDTMCNGHFQKNDNG